MGGGGVDEHVCWGWGGEKWKDKRRKKKRKLREREAGGRQGRSKTQQNKGREEPERGREPTVGKDPLKGTVNVPPKKKSNRRSKQLNNRQQQVNDTWVSTLNHPSALSHGLTHTYRPGAQWGACGPTNHLYIKTSLCCLTAAKIPARPRCHKSSAVAELQREPFHLGMSKLSWAS